MAPTKAEFSHEASLNPVSGASQTASANALTLDCVYLGTVAQSTAVLEINDIPAAPSGVLTMTGICGAGMTDGDRMDAWVRINSPNTRWTGTAYDALLNLNNMRRWIAYTGSSGQCGIQVLHPNTTLPPTGGPSPRAISAMPLPWAPATSP